MRKSNLDKLKSDKIKRNQKFVRTNKDKKPGKKAPKEDTKKRIFSFLYGIFAVLGLVSIIILYFVIPVPAPIWMYVVAGSFWLISGISKLLFEPSWIIIFSFINAATTYVMYLFHYGLI